MAFPCKAGLAGGLATINFNNSSLSGFGGSYSEQDLNGTYQGEDTFTWTPGRHTVKLGGMYRSVFFDSSASSLAPNGEFSFDGHYTSQYINGVANSATGNAFADFLLDLPDLAQISAIHTNNYRRYAISLFGQDFWKLSPKLTVNFGMRWDFVTPVWEAHNHGSILNPNTAMLNVPHYTGAFPTATQAQFAKGIITLNTKANRYFGVQPDHHDFGPACRLQLSGHSHYRIPCRLRALLRSRTARPVRRAQPRLLDSLPVAGQLPGRQ